MRLQILGLFTIEIAVVLIFFELFFMLLHLFLHFFGGIFVTFG